MECVQKKQKSLATKNRFTPTTIVMLVILSLYVLILFTLLYWAVITSLKSQDEFYNYKYQFPKELYLNFIALLNYSVRISVADGDAMVSGYVKIQQQFFNSLFYSVGCAFVKTLTTCIVAYCCTKFKNKFSKIVYNTVIVAMIIPIVGSLPAELAMAKTFGFYDKVWGMWIMQMNFLGMYFLVFCSGFAAMPDTYSEAAKIDGANQYDILFRIALPFIRSLFGTIFLVNFITYWNDYQTPLVYMPTHPTLAYGILRLAQGADNELSTTPMRIAGPVMLMIPVLILFMIFQKKMLGNLNVGGIKG